MGLSIGSSLQLSMFCVLAFNLACAPQRDRNASMFQAAGSADLKGTKLTVMCRMGAQENNPNDSMACGEIFFDGTKWHLHARIGVWGAESFAVDYPTRAKELADVKAYQISVKEPNLASEKYFKKVAGEPGGMPQSFGKIPAVKKMIENQFVEINKMYNTDFLETKLEVFFINTLPIRKKVGLSDTDATPLTVEAFLRPEVLKLVLDKPFLPIKFAALPNLSVIVPGEWDPYTHPELNAHELFHILSRDHHNEGYIYKDYPADGIMNGGAEFKVLRSKGFAPQLNLVELNTLLFNQSEFANRPPEFAGLPPEILKTFEPNYYTSKWKLFTNSPGSGRGTTAGFKAELNGKMDSYFESGAKLRKL